MRFDADYREHITLEDGTRLRLRTLKPADTPALLEGFSRLSALSRYRRFLGPKKALDEHEIELLTDPDGIRDYVIVAVRLDDEARELDGVALARFARLDDEPEVAEIGITVIDEWQRRGIGTALLDRTVTAAAERGIERIRAYILSDNRRMISLLHRYPGCHALSRESGVTVFEFDTAMPAREDRPAEHLLEMLRMAARGALVVPLVIGLTSVELVSRLRREDRDSAPDES